MTRVSFVAGKTAIPAFRSKSLSLRHKLSGCAIIGLAFFGVTLTSFARAADTTAPTVPTNLAATAVSTTQINVTWTASTDAVGVTGYQVDRCQGASCTNYAQIATPTTTSYNDTGRTASTTYRYRVRARDAVPNWSGYPAAVSATTLTPDTTAPTVPTNLAATPVSTTQVNLTWTASTDAVGVTGYQVDRCTGASCSTYTQIATPATTSFSDTGRTAGTVYRYRVRARDAVPNWSAYSSTVNATTLTADTTAPSVPAGLTATPISTTQINLTWTASTDAVGVTGYQVDRCTGASCTTFSQIATPTTTSFNDTGRTASTTYRYRVRARDAVPNWSAYSSIVNATALATDTQAPSVPAGLAATPASSTQINLTWTPSTDNIAVTGYRIERCTGSVCTSFNQIATSATASYSDVGRSPLSTYRYRIRAYDAIPNVSGYSTIVSATTLAPPDTEAPSIPTAVTATAVSGVQVNLSWDPSFDDIGITGYLLERCVGVGCSNYSQIASVQTLTYNDGSRSPATTYGYRIRAFDAANNRSGYSVGVSAITFPDTQPPTKPVGLQATTISSTQIRLNWSSSTDDISVAGYAVERCSGSGCTNFAPIGTFASTTTNDSGLPIASFSYRVRALDTSNNVSAFSNIATAVTVPSGGGSGTTQYIYDPLGRIFQSIGPSGKVTEYHYDSNGNVTQITRGQIAP